ncbi:hypothetical protein ACFWFX_34990 [Streptomyces roseolus]|uniref:hypothetical protein n=1 Tax=Streptomyces roseolus TaxID=67358 RepID=UPI0036593A37
MGSGRASAPDCSSANTSLPSPVAVPCSVCAWLTCGSFTVLGQGKARRGVLDSGRWANGCTGTRRGVRAGALPSGRRTARPFPAAGGHLIPATARRRCRGGARRAASGCGRSRRRSPLSSTAALEEAGDDVQRRLDMLVECLVLFHAHRRDLAFIAYSEIRSLTGEARGTSIGARDRRQRLGAAARGGGRAQGAGRAATCCERPDESARSVLRALLPEAPSYC